MPLMALVKSGEWPGPDEVAKLLMSCTAVKIPWQGFSTEEDALVRSVNAKLIRPSAQHGGVGDTSVNRSVHVS